MQALTLWQPWAWAMAFAGKPVENRTWAPPHSLLGQRIAIHAGKTCDEKMIDGIGAEFGIVPATSDVPLLGYGNDLQRIGHLARGAVVAVGTLAGYVLDDGNGRVIPAGMRVPDEYPPEKAKAICDETMRVARASRWYQGPVGWIVVNRIALPTPVPCRGAQGLWTLPPDVEAAVMRQIGEVGRG
jgi:hypothetical protein